MKLMTKKMAIVRTQQPLLNYYKNDANDANETMGPDHIVSLLCLKEAWGILTIVQFHYEHLKLAP